jgi:anti-anti-sigma regulatory factor
VTGCEQEFVRRSLVVRLRGMFFTPEEIATLDDALSCCLKARASCVVVNWSGIEHLNSVGFGVLIKFELALLKQGRSYRNCSLPKRCLEMISMFKSAGFHWHIFRTEEEAVQSCPENRADDQEGKADSNRSSPR